jgi:hypothetical protein
VHLDNNRQIGPHLREHSSGTSVRGKTRITKIGGAVLCRKLFVCSFSAKKSDAACRAAYERLVTRGNNDIVALITVCIKLLKQAFAIIKSGIPYETDFAKFPIKARLFNTGHLSSLSIYTGLPLKDSRFILLLVAVLRRKLAYEAQHVKTIVLLLEVAYMPE